MADAQKPLTPSAIKYLLTLLELCQKDAGARCMDIAEQLRVTKPSVHSMIENLCAAGLAEKKKYGTVFLTPEGRTQAERYAVCCSLLRGRMQQTLGLNEEDARSAACAVLAQLPDAVPQMIERLSRGYGKGGVRMELLTSVLVAGGVCACIGAVKAVCRRLTKR